MFIRVLAVLVVIMFGITFGASINNNLPAAANDAPVPEPRITCDLLSGLGWNHALCAAHCLAIWGGGYTGGYCNSQGVCVCRK